MGISEKFLVAARFIVGNFLFQKISFFQIFSRCVIYLPLKTFNLYENIKNWHISSNRMCENCIFICFLDRMLISRKLKLSYFSSNKFASFAIWKKKFDGKFLFWKILYLLVFASHKSAKILTKHFSFFFDSTKELFSKKKISTINLAATKILQKFPFLKTPYFVLRKKIAQSSLNSYHYRLAQCSRLQCIQECSLQSTCQFWCRKELLERNSRKEELLWNKKVNLLLLLLF